MFILLLILKGLYVTFLISEGVINIDMFTKKLYINIYIKGKIFLKKN